ncbi:MAG TPA: SpoIIE family protein phosphatase [bacterium]
MLFHLTDLTPEPLHNQLSRQLVERILNGDLVGGRSLPSIRHVARAHHVNVNTVKRAYDDLEQDGLIERHNGEAHVTAPLSAEKKRLLAARWFNDGQAPMSLVATVSKQLISVFDPGKLCGLLIGTLKTHFLGTRVSLAIQNENGGLIIPASPEFPEDFVIDDEDAFLQSIGKMPAAADFAAIQPARGGALFHELCRRGAKIIVPLRDQEELLGFLALSKKTGNEGFSHNDLHLLTIIANQFVTALTAARLYVEVLEKRRIDEELNMAQRIQRELLPSELPDNDYLQIAAVAEPARIVGGDFYDVIPMSGDRLGVVIADACGQGLPAAMLVSQIQALMRSEISNGHSVSRVLQNVNQQLSSLLPGSRFVTLFYGVIACGTGEFEYATAGHTHPILIQDDGHCRQLAAGGPALGLMQRASFETARLQLGSGDLIVLFTDGVSETMNSNHEEYGEDRLAGLLVQNRLLACADILQVVRESLRAFGGAKSIPDDRTLMAVRIKGRR